MADYRKRFASVNKWENENGGAGLREQKDGSLSFYQLAGRKDEWVTSVEKKE